MDEGPVFDGDVLDGLHAEYIWRTIGRQQRETAAKSRVSAVTGGHYLN